MSSKSKLFIFRHIFVFSSYTQPLIWFLRGVQPSTCSNWLNTFSTGTEAAYIYHIWLSGHIIFNRFCVEEVKNICVKVAYFLLQRGSLRIVVGLKLILNQLFWCFHLLVSLSLVVFNCSRNIAWCHNSSWLHHCKG